MVSLAGGSGGDVSGPGAGAGAGMPPPAPLRVPSPLRHAGATPLQPVVTTAGGRVAPPAPVTFPVQKYVRLATLVNVALHCTLKQWLEEAVRTYVEVRVPHTSTLCSHKGGGCSFVCVGLAGRLVF